MGSKGQTTTQNQTQTYNPAGAGYVQNALNMAGNAASQPFNMPLQQIAGLTGQQNQAFGAFGQAYNAAQPYYNQASNLYQQSANTDVNQYLNPYIDQVTAQMNNVFGKQMSQTTGQLTQAAGGVGADRIAVGQGNLANQQALAAGQTYSGIYQNALSAAQQQQGILQNAAAGTAGLGQTAQNSALQGAQALYGSGALQQNQQQNQLNAQYQYDMQKAQFPYQQANFYGGLVSALAPGLGGTTTGQSETTTPGPSIWSQILGGGMAAAGLAGGFGGFGSMGSLFNTPNTGAINNSMSMLNNNTGGAFYGPGFASGGGVRPINPFPNPFTPRAPGNDNDAGPFSPRRPGGANDNGEKHADGGAVDERTRQEGLDRLRQQMTARRPAPVGRAIRDGAVNGMRNYSMMGFAEGGDVDAGDNPFVPSTQIRPIQAHMPQLQFSQPQQQGGGGGGGGGGLGDLAKMAMMFVKRGGAIPGYAGGGIADDDVINPDEPFRMADQPSVDAWRQGVADDTAAGLIHPQGEAPAASLPPEIASGASRKPTASAVPPESALAFAGDRSPMRVPQQQAPATQNPYVIPISDRAQQRSDSFSQSPWAALTAAGLGMLSGTSPNAGVNIGQGGLAGLKLLEQQGDNARKEETIAQAAKRLEQEAKFHEDQYTRMTPYQAAQVQAQQSRDKLAWEQFERPYKELTKPQQAQIDQANRPYREMTEYQKAQLEQQKRQQEQSRVPLGYFRNKDTGELEVEKGGPHDPERIRAEAEAKRPPGMTDEALEPLVESYMKGNTGVLAGVGRGVQGAQNLEKFWSMMAQKLKDRGLGGADLAAARANFMAQSAGMRVAAQRESNIETAVNEAKDTFPEVLRTSSLLPRSEFIPYNQLMEYVRTKTGSPEQRAYGAAIQAAVTAYSQAMSRTGTNSVYAQQHAAEILARADGHKAIEATLKQLDREMEIALSAPEKTRLAIVNRILGRPMDEGDHGAGPPAQTKMSPQDQQAIDWANANPNDPRAAAIKKRLGVQ